MRYKISSTVWIVHRLCVSSLTDGNSKKTTFSYNTDNANNVKTGVAYPNGVTMTIGYDTGGRETWIVGKNSGATWSCAFSL